MCQEGAGYVEWNVRSVGTLPEPGVVVKRVEGGDRGVDVVSGPVAGVAGEVREAVAKAIAVPVTAAVKRAFGGELDESDGREPKDVKVGREAVGDDPIGAIYEILTDPKLSGNIDGMAIALAKALSVVLPSESRYVTRDRGFVIKLRDKIFDVAKANGMDKEVVRLGGLLPDFLENIE